MSTDADPNATNSLPTLTQQAANGARLSVKFSGKDAAYATPVVVASISAVHGQAPISRPAVSVTPAPPSPPPPSPPPPSPPPS